MALPDRGARRGIRGGQLDRGGDPAGQLGAHRVSGLDPGRHSRILAWRVSSLPGPPRLELVTWPDGAAQTVDQARRR